MTNSLQEDLVLAHRLIETASEIALVQQPTLRNWKTKHDGSPVTETDLQIESELTRVLSIERPDDSISGEELGVAGSSDRRWIIDPIDGTSHFIEGRSDWGTHVALSILDQIVLGIVSRPLASLSWYATKQGGAYRMDWKTSLYDAISVSDVSDPQDCKVAVWEPSDGRLAGQLSSNIDVVESNLDAILHLAEGRLDAVIDTAGKPWDHAPYTILVEEAGGRYSDCDGGRRIDHGQVLYSNGRIHDFLTDLISVSDA